jgi:Mrp family chromosome partitioning ATPase
VAQGAGGRNPASWKSYLWEMRREFEYSIVGEPFPGEWNEATAMARFADGIILVLSAHRTRRIRARTMKNKLEAAQAHILGTVLSDRTFPIPEGIYRRL